MTPMRFSLRDRWRMVAALRPALAGDHNDWSVHLQAGNCRAANRGAPSDLCRTVYPLKMICPDLRARIKEGYRIACFRINTLGCRMFVAVAVPAGQTQILQPIAAVRINMIDLHGLSGVRFGSLTVFTAAVRALPYDALNGIPRCLRTRGLSHAAA